MNTEDTVRCQHAIKLANSGQKQMAYQLFCALYPRNAKEVTLLYWLAYTTPSPEEAQRAIATIARIEPDHPKLQALQQHVQSTVYIAPGGVGPVLQCPYCHHVGPVRVAQKISTGGWICFGVLLFAFLPLCWIGLLIKRDQYACGMCGIVLGAMI